MGTREDISENDIVKKLFLGNPVSPLRDGRGGINRGETEVTSKAWP
ncbi:hypothetical protein JCM13304A_06570 [Desulfothermus okinawensis JCM 13304]